MSTRNMRGNVGFAIGTGRCGTKFLAEVMTQESYASSVHERNPLNETFHRYCKWYNLPVDHGGFLHTKTLEIQQDLEQYRFSFEASAFLSLSVQELYDRFDAKFILLLRNPIKVINSYLRKGWYEKPFIRENPDLALGYQDCRMFHHFLGRIVPSGEPFERWNQMSRVGKLAWYWKTLNSSVIEQFEKIPETHWRIERLEDLDYDRYLELTDFLGFRSTVPRRAYQKLQQCRPNALDRIPTPADWSETEVAEFEAEVAAIAQRFGYESLVRQRDTQDPPASAPVKPAQKPVIRSLIQLSAGNLPSQMANSVQVAKMAQAFSEQVEAFELVTSGDIGSALKREALDLQDWYGLQRPFKVVQIPTHLRKKTPFPQGYYGSPNFYRLAALYARYKSPSLIYTRTPGIVRGLMRLKLPVLWEWHEPIEPHSAHHALLTNPDLLGVITISQQLAQHYIDQGLNPNKVLVEHDAVDLHRFSGDQSRELARHHLGLPLESKVIVYAGHLYDHKGIPTLLEVAKRLPTYEFVLAGGWPEDVQRVKAICQQENLSNVCLLGHLPQSKLTPCLYAADVLLLPTSGQWNLADYTSPLKLFDYMAACRPIVASALPNIKTVLQDGVNGLLVEPDNPDAFQAAIATLFTHEALAHTLAEKAFQDVHYYTWEKRVERILEFAERRIIEVQQRGPAAA